MYLWWGIVLCNVFWALNPIFFKILVTEVGALPAAYLRYSLAFLGYLFLRMIQFSTAPKDSGGAEKSLFVVSATRKDWFFIFMIGFSVAFVAPLTQSIGLLSSSATNNVVLVALEPLFTVALAYFILKERLSKSQIINLLIAFFGLMIFLRVYNLSSSENAEWGIFWGDLLFCLATLAEASFSVFGKKVSGRHAPLRIYGSALFFGLILLTTFLAFKGSFSAGNRVLPISFLGWCAALWLGILGSVLSYVYWLFCLGRGFPVSKMAITLFIQPIVGAAAGVLFLGEVLHPTQFIGACLLFYSVYATIRADARSEKNLVETK